MKTLSVGQVVKWNELHKEVQVMSISCHGVRVKDIKTNAFVSSEGYNNKLVSFAPETWTIEAE